MRHIMRAIVGVALGWAAVSSALAQTTTSSDSIIKALKPAPQMEGTSRGIKIAPEASAPAAATAPQAAPSIDLTVTFASGSADLTPQAKSALDALGRAIASKDLATYRFRIEGHTDTVGTPEFNQDLSTRRAEAAVAYLESNFGVDHARLVPIGMGMDELAVQTGPQVDEPRNRRVHVVNLGS